MTLREGNLEAPTRHPIDWRSADFRDEGDWRLFVLDLDTMRATRLAGDDPIDDQAEWLDDDHVVYGVDNILWQVRADGTGRPIKLLTHAYSPAVDRAS